MRKLISTFSGVGGSSLGYRRAGFKVVYAVEHDKKAAEAYQRNFPDTPVYIGDIEQLDTDALKQLTGEDIDVIDGSPPCQGFSSASRNHGKPGRVDPRNRLFEEYVRVIEAYMPKAIIMENVTGMLRGKNKVVFAEINERLRQAGYKTAVRELNAWWYGTPQSRRRLIWIGYREDLGIEPSHPPKELERALPVADFCPDIEWVPPLFNGVTARNTRVLVTGMYDAKTNPIPTLTANTWTPKILDKHGKMRPLTTTERLLLSGFPLDWHTTIKGAGNAVPPPMARAIGEHVFTTLEQHERLMQEV